MESVYFGELVVSTSTRSLIRTQMALEIVKDESDPSAVSNSIQKMAVVGSNDLGAEITSLSADADIRVRVKGSDDNDVGSGLKSCYDYFREKYENQEISEIEFEHKFDLISATSDYS